MNDWKVRGQTGSCHACETTFSPQARFYSALYFVPPEVERRDFCPPCWEALSADQTVAYWVLRAPEDETDVTDVGPLDMNRIKRLIRVDLQKETAPPGLAGLLALMMVRRKMARLIGVEGERIRVKFRDEDEPFEVPAPHLQGETLDRAQAALWDLLDQAGSNG
jgi:hypothetical protein